MVGGQAHLALRRVSIASTASPSATPGARLNEMVIGGKQALVIDGERRVSAVRSA